MASALISSTVNRQDLLREVNGRIRALSRHDDDLSGFLCECGREDCSEVLELTTEEFDTIRSRSQHFLVARGHELGAISDVVESMAHYEVVRRIRV